MTNYEVKQILYTKHGKVDIFGYLPTKKYKLTLHHIKPRRDGGKTTEENGAILRWDIHQLLNRYELENKANGDYINNYIRRVKVLQNDNPRRF